MPYYYASRTPRRLLGALVTAGSRLLFQAEVESGLLNTGSMLDEFRRFLQQRGLTIENVTYEDLGVSILPLGARIIRVWVQVVTPIDRAQEADLTYDMTQDLQRAANAPVENAFLTVMVRAGKDPQGNPIYQGGSPSLPNIQPPGPQEKGFFDEIAESLKVKKTEAQLVVFGGAALLAIVLMKR